LRHRFEVVHGLRGFDFHGPDELPARRSFCEHQIRENLHLADPDGDGLVFADVCDDFVPPLQLHLQQPDDPIVLELFPHWPYQDWAH
jgi:hypothetical protein